MDCFSVPLAQKLIERIKFFDCWCGKFFQFPLGWMASQAVHSKCREGATAVAGARVVGALPIQSILADISIEAIQHGFFDRFAHTLHEHMRDSVEGVVDIEVEMVARLKDADSSKVVARLEDDEVDASLLAGAVVSTDASQLFVVVPRNVPERLNLPASFLPCRLHISAKLLPVAHCLDLSH